MGCRGKEATCDDIPKDDHIMIWRLRKVKHVLIVRQIEKLVWHRKAHNIYSDITSMLVWVKVAMSRSMWERRYIINRGFTPHVWSSIFNLVYNLLTRASLLWHTSVFSRTIPPTTHHHYSEKEAYKKN